jgi:rare lipoprotein A
MLKSLTLIASTALFLTIPCLGKPPEHGIASFYSTKIGTKTASGVPLCDKKLTAAHKTLPFGTKVLVTRERNGKSVEVTITDRGPFIKGRVIDLSVAAAKKLNMTQDGIAKVKVEVIAPPPKK